MVGPVAWRFQKIGFPLAQKLLDIARIWLHETYETYETYENI
jgi:hypothetical protein